MIKNETQKPRINIVINRTLRDKHKKICLEFNVSQSDRVRQYLKHDLKAYEQGYPFLELRVEYKQKGEQTRMNIHLPRLLRENHKNLCKNNNTSQSSRIRDYLLADIEKYNASGAILSLDYIRSLSDLLPTTLSGCRYLSLRTNVDAFKLQKIAIKEFSSFSLEDKELNSLSEFLGKSFEELKSLQADEY